MGICLSRRNRDAFNTEISVSVDEANYWGHYSYQIEENYFTQERLETKQSIYREKMLAVGSFAPNAWGLYDMHGNVSEWVWDLYEPYTPEAASDPIGSESGTRRVNRGGAWNDFAKNLRSAYRAAAPAESASFAIGFRVPRNARQLDARQVVESNSAQVNETESGRTLIAYFSWGGNTRGIAEEIQRQTGFDLFESNASRPIRTTTTRCLSRRRPIRTCRRVRSWHRM